MSEAFLALIRSAPVRMWALICAGPPMTLFAGALVWIVWRGGWAEARAEQQLFYLGTSLFITLGVIAVIVVALASARVKGQGPGGISLDIEGSADPVLPTTKTTATVTTETKS